MIGVGFTDESACGALDKQWCLYNQSNRLELVTIIGIVQTTMP